MRTHTAFLVVAALFAALTFSSQTSARAFTQNSSNITDFGHVATYPFWQQAYGGYGPSVVSAALYYNHWLANSGADPEWQMNAPAAPWMDPIDYTVSFSNLNPAPGTPTYLNVGVIRLTVPSQSGIHFVGLGHYAGNVRAPFTAEFFRTSGATISISDLTATAVATYSPAIFTPDPFEFNYVDGQRYQHFPAPVNYGVGWWAMPKLEDIVLQIPSDFADGETIGLRIMASNTNAGDLGLMLAPYIVSASGDSLPAQGLLLDVVPEPSTYALLLMTGAGALWWSRRKR